jgi:hypothetical protein
MSRKWNRHGPRPLKTDAPPTSSSLPTLKGLLKLACDEFMTKYGHLPTSAIEIKEAEREACAIYDRNVKLLRGEGYRLDPDAVSADGLTQDIRLLEEID